MSPTLSASVYEELMSNPPQPHPGNLHALMGRHISLAACSKFEGKKSSSKTANLLGSAVAGISELILFHPIDTIAKRMMTNQSDLTLSNASAVIFKDAAGKGVVEKWLSLFPGLGFAAAYKVTQRIYKFGGQPIVNDLMDNHLGHWFRQKLGDKNGQTFMHAFSGSLIGVGEVLLLPLDVLKIKRQTNPEALKGRNLVSLFTTQYRELYRGAGWTAARNAPGSFALFGGSAFVKETIFELKDHRKATVFQNFCASIAGATLSIAVAQPLDVIKTRIQQRGFDSPEKGTTILRNLIQKEGAAALLKGLTPKIISVGPKLVFSMTVAQSMISWFDERFR